LRILSWRGLDLPQDKYANLMVKLTSNT